MAPLARPKLSLQNRDGSARFSTRSGYTSAIPKVSGVPCGTFTPLHFLRVSYAMKLSVVVPTYRRTDSLEQCLHGLQRQTRPAEEVLVVIREDDEESSSVLMRWASWPELKVVRSQRGGQVAQLNKGLDVLTGDVVAFTDDDAIPHSDWLARIEEHFIAQPDLGGVGGRDHVEENGQKLVGNKSIVGTVQWFGRIAGNHHIGGRLVRTVDCLKGVNMSFRIAAVGSMRFDVDLRGTGAQTCNDWAFSLAVKKQGWRLLYDPAVAVDHFPAVRFDDDQRNAPTLQAVEDSAYNEHLSLWRHMQPGPRKMAALCWAWLIGIRNNPGALRGFISLLKRDPNGTQLRQASRRAWKAVRQLH